MTKSTRPNDKSASTKNNSKTNETESNKTKNKPNKVSKKQKNDAQNASSRKRTSSKKKKTSNHPVLHLTCYCALFFILLAILLFDIDQVDTVAMQPALHKDDIVVSFAPPFVHPTPQSVKSTTFIPKTRRPIFCVSSAVGNILLLTMRTLSAPTERP